MRQVVIMQSDRYELTSYGNGLAYRLRNKERGRSLFVQGDEATSFRDELNAIENANPDWPIDRTFRWLLNECCWGEAMEYDNE